MLELNKEAMDMLASIETTVSSYGQTQMRAPEPLKKLKEAVALLDEVESRFGAKGKRLMALSLNNLACYYKRCVISYI